MTMQRSAVFAFALVASAVPAAAFDCAKASTEIEKAICADPAALAANDRMETVYFAMRDRLKGTPGEAILKDGQRAWLRHRDAFCNPEAECLASESDGRAQALAKTPESAAPFMIWQAFKPGIYQVAISGPRFFDRSVPGAAIYERWFDELVAQSPYGKPADKDLMDAFALDHQIEFSINSRTARLFSASAWFSDFSGGAHGASWTETLNIDLATGREIDMKSAIGAAGLGRLEQECLQQIAKEKSERIDDLSVEQATKEILETYPQAVAEHVGESKRWVFESEDAVILFDSYAIGSYAEGQFECRFPRLQVAGVANDPALFAN